MYDLRQFPRYILWEMQEITQANLFGHVNEKERVFWYDRHRAINLELQRRRDYEDPDLSRTVSGAGRPTSGVPDPDDPPRDVQARVSKVDTSYRTFGRSLNRKTAEGARNLGFRGASFKKPQVGQLE